jgi:dynein heavy chain
MFRTGIDGEKVSFVMTDTQIISESFIEDINNMLNTGEIPNLYLPEDKDKIVNSVREIVIQMKKLETVDNINFVYN